MWKGEKHKFGSWCVFFKGCFQKDKHRKLQLFVNIECGNIYIRLLLSSCSIRLLPTTCSYIILILLPPFSHNYSLQVILLLSISFLSFKSFMIPFSFCSFCFYIMTRHRAHESSERAFCIELGVLRYFRILCTESIATLRM